MLTVLHRHNDGTESIYEARAVRRECLGPPTIPPGGDILVIGVGDDCLFGGPGSCHEGDGVIRISSRWMDPEGFDESRVFVMNRFGQTVAQHRVANRAQGIVTE